MIIFAHNGELHPSSSEGIVHALPELIGVSIVMVVIILLIVKQLSAPTIKTKQESEEL